MPDVSAAQKAMAARAKPRGSKKSPTDPKKVAGIVLGISIGFGIILNFANPAKGGQSLINDPSLIENINKNAKGWHAGAAPTFEGWNVNDVREFGQVSWRDTEAQWHLCPPPMEDSVPEAFDAREKWESCFANPHIYDQGNCSASWAIAAAQSVARRYCIQEPEKYPEFVLSPQSILSCDDQNDGCKGGGMDTVWNFLTSEGVVSETCHPTKWWEGECSAKCEDETPLKVQAKCAVQGVDVIKREILSNGPVVAQLALSDEIMVYKGGIFTPTPTNVMFHLKGGRRQKKAQMVLLLGWGSEDDQDYWIIENSWGKEWGENGYAKIAYNAMKADDTSPTDSSHLITEVVFVGYPTNMKYANQGGAGEYNDLDFEEDLDDIDLDLDIDDDDEDLFADLDLEDTE